MSHHVRKSGFLQLIDRLNKFPQGAPQAPLLMKILSILFSERDAELVSRLPLKPFTAAKAAKILNKSEQDAVVFLDALAERALLLDLEAQGERVYVLPPPMAGFFEFSLMRVRTDIDQKALSELFYEYLNVEDGFIRALFTIGETQLGRVMVHEPALSAENSAQVLDYERASEVIRTARHIGIGLCYCRHKMSHLGKACTAPREICMSFNGVADSLIRHGHIRAADRVEALDLLQEAHEQRLVQFADNVREGVNFICNCCGCCCEAMLAARRFMDRCLGCGSCVRVCPAGALHLESRPQRVLTPVNTAHRVVLMAIERDCLQNLIFDNQALTSHRAMAAILGVILRLPPVKQLMASRQMKSRYLERLLARQPFPA
ncbi:MAG: 4Fe-4S binding protein [Geobacter sp.]|nr:4Fe-4S binding protein [Geobacter sp.]